MALTFSSLGARQTESDIARLMSMALDRPDLLSLAAGFTDNATLPQAEVGRIAAEIERRGDPAPLQYGSNQGRRDLRAIMGARLAEQDGAAGEAVYGIERAIVTNGSQQALYLAVQTLCDPGDIILVEQPTYFVFLEMLRGLGVEAVPMPICEDGAIDLDGLRSQIKAYETAGLLGRVKAVYMVSYYANPTGDSVTQTVKDGVVNELARHGGRIALLEDAAYRELYYGAKPRAKSALASGTAAEVPIFYTTTLTKPFASGLKVGYGYCSDKDWLACMLAVKGQQDFGTGHYAQAILAEALENGDFDRHLARIRRSYYEKMDVLDRCLREPLSAAGWSWHRPDGGLYLWLKAPRGMLTGFDSAFYAACIESGVMYVPGELCYPLARERDRVRLSFGVLHLPELAEAAKRFIDAAMTGSAVLGGIESRSRAIGA